MQKVFAHYKAVMLSLNMGSCELGGCDGPEARELGEGLASMNQGWMLACTGLEEWQDSLRTTVMRCQVSYCTVTGQWAKLFEMTSCQAVLHTGSKLFLNFGSWGYTSSRLHIFVLAQQKHT